MQTKALINSHRSEESLRQLQDFQGARAISWFPNISPFNFITIPN